MKSIKARLNRKRTSLICGACEKPIAEWIERDERLPGIGDAKLRQARFLEGMGYDDEAGVWRMSNRARNRQARDETARRFAVDRLPPSPVNTFEIHGSAELVAWLSSVGIAMPDSSHADEDQHHVRQQAQLPFKVDCPHCGRRNRADV